jgi:Rrf2 family cysteine metabolism transcriptional repressor
MRISTRTQYGFRILCQLTLEFQKGPLQLSEMGSREGISEKYLGQIMLILRNSGLVSAQRGSQGGYFLSRPPDAITVLEAFNALEGEVLGLGEEDAPVEAKSGERRDTSLAIGELLSRLRAAMTAELGRYSLAELVTLAKFRSGFLEFQI